MDEAGAQLTGYLSQYRTQWVALCFLLIAIDVGYLGFRTLIGHDVREPFWPFVTQRVGIILLLIVTGLVDWLLPNLPLLYVACLFYSGVSLLHIITQIREEGVEEIPPEVLERAEQLRGGDVPPRKT